MDKAEYGHFEMAPGLEASQSHTEMKGGSVQEHSIDFSDHVPFTHEEDRKLMRKGNCR